MISIVFQAKTNGFFRPKTLIICEKLCENFFLCPWLIMQSIGHTNLTIFEKFDFLEVDFRINVYARCIKKNFKVISEDVTVYRKVDDSIMVNIKKYSKKWWIKRKEAHEFMKDFFLKNQLVYENKFDYYLTNKISKFLL